MKFSKSGHALLAAAVSLGIALGITSCGQSNTIDYLFVTASKNQPGQISVFRVDLESGALTQIADSPYSSGGRNPVAEVTSPNGANLYVVNQLDNTVVEFAIGTDGKLYPQHTYNTPGTNPIALTMDPTGSLLFVVDGYQAGYTDANPGPGALVVYPVNADGSLGANVANTSVTPNLPYFPVQSNPMSVNVAVRSSCPKTVPPTTYYEPVYVVNANTSVQAGTVSALAIPVVNGTTSVTGDNCVVSSGALTPIAGSPFSAGVAPNASASDPTGRFYYVTDSATNQLIAYNITGTGAIVPVEAGPFATGVFPDAITIDLTGTYIYVANYNSNSISAYQITPKNGAPSGLSGAGSFATDTGPTCVMVDPAFNRFVYTSNFLGNSVTGYQLNPNTGALTGTENSPYPTGATAAQPTCVAAIAHGNHPGEHVQATAGTGAD
jgi:6-phosphogluconolactonase